MSNSSGGYDAFIDALESASGYYDACTWSNGYDTLSPRRARPRCGDLELGSEPLRSRDETVTYTTVAETETANERAIGFRPRYAT